MKKFEEAELEVMTFESNVITTSVCTTKQEIECADACNTKCTFDGVCYTDTPCPVKGLVR